MPDPLYVTKAEEHDPEGPAVGEDLAALLSRHLADTGKTQKDLASESGIGYKRLNSWITRERGTSRISPEDLRALANILRRWGANVTPALVFESAGRPVPGPADAEREKRLLTIYRQLPTRSQRALLEHAESMQQSLLAS